MRSTETTDTLIQDILVLAEQGFNGTARGILLSHEKEFAHCRTLFEMLLARVEHRWPRIKVEEEG